MAIDRRVVGALQRGSAGEAPCERYGTRDADLPDHGGQRVTALTLGTASL